MDYADGLHYFDYTDGYRYYLKVKGETRTGHRAEVSSALREYYQTGRDFESNYTLMVPEEML